MNPQPTPPVTPSPASAVNVAIAAALGTHTYVVGQRPGLDVPIYRVTDRNGKTGDFWDGGSSTPLGFEFPRRYAESLDAMHEAEKTLTSRQRTLFELTLLHEVLGRPEPFNYDRGDIFAVITATAAQRAEAFLRTLNLWPPATA